MISSLILSVLLGFGSVKRSTAYPIGNDTDPQPCMTFTLQVPVTAQNNLWNMVPVNNNIDAVSYAVDLDTWDNPSLLHRVTDNITISRTYGINAQLCVPPNGSKSSTLHLATHGGGFDSRYWKAAVDPTEHSYVHATLEAGYSILTYDRIGCGLSTKPDAYTDVQIPAEVEVLRGITEMVRDGTISRLISAAPGPWRDGLQFNKIVHVGHSIGSITTYGLMALYPNISDAAILTGFLVDTEVFSGRLTAQDLQYAPENDPFLFAGSSSGYVLPGTPSAYQTGFFSSRVNTSTGIGGFDPLLLEYAYSIRQPTPQAEMISGVKFVLEHPIATGFTSPVQLVLGEFDFLVCLGDCKNTFNSTGVGQMFPQARDVSIHMQPGTGHGLPLHNNASLGFKASFDWLEGNSL